MRISLEQYKSRHMAISPIQYSDEFWINQHRLYLNHQRRAIKINWFERYFNTKTGGQKNYQFINAFDILLWESGYRITNTSYRARRWQKEGKYFWVSSFTYGDDPSCWVKIPSNLDEICV